MPIRHLASNVSSGVPNSTAPHGQRLSTIERTTTPDVPMAIEKVEVSPHKVICDVSFSEALTAKGIALESYSYLRLRTAARYVVYLMGD